MKSNNAEIGRHLEALLAEGERMEVRFLGDSMLPYLRGGGDTVVLDPHFTPEELRPGAIVFFRHRERYIVHRILRNDDGRLLIQGDGNVKGTERAPSGDVLAMVREVIRPGGRRVSPYSVAGRFYWVLWRTLKPLRPWLLAIRRRLF